MKTTTKEKNETKRQAKNAKQPRKLPDLALKKDVRGGEFVFTHSTDKASPGRLP